MNHSPREYLPTIIENRLLIRRLAFQIAFLNYELKRAWVDFDNDPIAFGAVATHSLVHHVKKSLSAPNLVGAALRGRPR